MKLIKRMLIFAGTGMLAALGLILAGCEVDSASSTIEISPDAAALSTKGQSVTLTCVGGYECTWTLSTDTWGYLSTRRGLQVVYTSLYQPVGETPVVQTVTVASRYTTMGGMNGTSILVGATNIPTTNIVYATAYITHLAIATNGL